MHLYFSECVKFRKSSEPPCILVNIKILEILVLAVQTAKRQLLFCLAIFYGTVTTLIELRVHIELKL